MIGAEAIRRILQELDLDRIANALREEIAVTTSELKPKKLLKRLKIIEAFQMSGNKPEWMILTVVPVIPRTCARWCPSTAAASRPSDSTIFTAG